MSQGQPYLITQDDDSQEPASFWHIRRQEEEDLLTALTIALQQPKLRFNKPLYNRLLLLAHQFRSGLKALEQTVGEP